MKIALKHVTIRQLVDGYNDNGKGGVVGYGGRLDVRPAYQREFVYKEKERNAVIDSVMKSYPLNTMYWAVLPNDRFEIIDGQQRTISIAQYVHGEFSFQDRNFYNLTKDEKKKILDYKLSVYTCDGEDSEKLAWFETVNIAGKPLTTQELRNAVYHGSWVSAAKQYFSKSDGPAHREGGNYLKGPANRQLYLEEGIRWISKNKISDYMAKHQHDKDAEALCKHFKVVIRWVKECFPEYRDIMGKGINWGELYDIYHKKKMNLSPEETEALIKELIQDEEVEEKKGIYAYIITGEEKHLNLRSFSDPIKQRVYENQNKKCKNCAIEFEIREMEADHIEPWSTGGRTKKENCQMLCRKCHKKLKNR